MHSDSDLLQLFIDSCDEAGNAARKAGRYHRALRDYLNESMNVPSSAKSLISRRSKKM